MATPFFTRRLGWSSLDPHHGRASAFPRLNHFTKKTLSGKYDHPMFKYDQTCIISSVLWVLLSDKVTVSVKLTF